MAPSRRSASCCNCWSSVRVPGGPARLAGGAGGGAALLADVAGGGAVLGAGPVAVAGGVGRCAGACTGGGAGVAVGVTTGADGLTAAGGRTVGAAGGVGAAGAADTGAVGGATLAWPGAGNGAGAGAGADCLGPGVWPLGAGGAAGGAAAGALPGPAAALARAASSALNLAHSATVRGRGPAGAGGVGWVVGAATGVPLGGPPAGVASLGGRGSNWGRMLGGRKPDRSMVPRVTGTSMGGADVPDCAPGGAPAGRTWAVGAGPVGAGAAAVGDAPGASAARATWPPNQPAHASRQTGSQVRQRRMTAGLAQGCTEATES